MITLEEYETLNLMQQAIHYFRSGDLGNAEQAARKILASQPRNFDALHLLGVINAIRGETKEAVRLFKKALALDAENAKLHANLAKALSETGKFQDALASYERAIKLGGASPEIMMDRGTALKNLERYPEALACYDQALALKPDYAEVWTNKGNLLEELQRYEEAIACHDRALSINPKLADAWSNKGIILDELEKYDAALACYDRAISLSPEDPGAWCNRGVTLRKTGRCDEALASYDKALGLKPGYAEVWTNRGLVLSALERCAEALASHDKALAIRPGYAEAWTGRGVALSKLKRHAEALASHDKALGIKPDHAETWMNRGIALSELKRHDEALASHDSALRIRPDYAEAWTGRGVALSELRRYDEALASYDKALTIKPDHAETWMNRGILFEELKRYDEAISNYQNAYGIKPDYAEAHFNGSICRLAIGDFEAGWREYEWRWISTKARKGRFPGIPEWVGEKSCRYLLAWAEQGVGDQILHSTMVEELKEYAQKVAVTLDARLVPLFERSFSGIQFLPCDQITAPQMQEVDRQIPVGSLGRYLRKTVGDFARNRPGFLISDAEKTQGLRARIRKDSRLICGLSWISKNQKFGSAKSLSLPDLMPILSLNNLSFVDLQYGDTSLERANLKAATGIDIEHLDDIDNFKDIDGLASLIDACDFVITTSNTTVHLAGALGKKTFLMVPGSRGKHWYWHEGHDHSLWYPSVRIFKQAIDADWKPVIDEVSKELRTAQNHTPPPSQPSP